MPSWEDQIVEILRKCGFIEGGPPPVKLPEAPLADWTTFQMDSEREGVLYRFDLFGVCPQMQVIRPVNTGRLKWEIYQVTLTPGQPFSHLYAVSETIRGSAAFERIQDTFSYHLFKAFSEMMRALFWQGNLERAEFPPEITVQCLLESSDGRR